MAYLSIYTSEDEHDEIKNMIEDLSKKFDRSYSSMGRQILKAGIAQFQEQYKQWQANVKDD